MDLWTDFLAMNIKGKVVVSIAAIFVVFAIIYLLVRTILFLIDGDIIMTLIVMIAMSAIGYATVVNTKPTLARFKK